MTCGEGDKSGDEDDLCGDKPDQPDEPKCPPLKKGGQPGKKKDMEAVAKPLESYSWIIFCNKFFNDLISLTDASGPFDKLE